MRWAERTTEHTEYTEGLHRRERRKAGGDASMQKWGWRRHRIELGWRWADMRCRLQRENDPPMKPPQSDPLSGRIFTLRGQRVILDADLARLYGVTTKRFNEAFRRNAGRFPKDFCFQLTAQEFAALRSQIATLDMEPPDKEVVDRMWSQIATTSETAGKRGKHRK